MNKVITILIFLISICSAFNHFQVDSKGGLFLSEKSPGEGGFDLLTPFIDNRMWVRKSLGKNVYLRISERFEGSAADRALYERTLPMNHYALLALGGHHKIDWHIGISNDVFINAKELIVPWYPLGSSMQSTLFSAGFMGIKAESKIVDAYLWGQYDRLNIDYIDENDSEKPAVDDELWGKAEVSIVPLDLIDIKVNALLKHDLNSSNYSNFSDIRLGGGKQYDLKLGRKRFYLDWWLMERILLSETLYNQNKPRGYRTELHFSPMLRVKNNLYLIAYAKVNYGEWYRKQRYRISLRKSWKNLSKIIFTCQTDLGNAAPRMIGDICGTAKINNLEISPRVDACWAIDSLNKFNFYRADAALEVSFEAFKRTEITATCQYSAFIDHTPYTNRIGFFLGVKR